MTKKMSEENALRKMAIVKAIGRQMEAIQQEDYFSLLSACQEVEIITRVFTEAEKTEQKRKQIQREIKYENRDLPEIKAWKK